MKTNLSYILPVWRACEILGEDTCRRIVSCLLQLEYSKQSQASRQASPLEDLEPLLQSLQYCHPPAGLDATTPIPPVIATHWKRWCASRSLSLDKATLVQFLVPRHVQPHAGAAGHQGLFDCLVHAIGGGGSETTTYYSGRGSGSSTARVLVPDVLIFLAVCQAYRQKQLERSLNPLNVETQVSDKEDQQQDDQESSRQDDHDDDDSEDEEIDEVLVAMSCLAFCMYDAYQKKGLVTRDTIHRFLTDVHGEDSYKQAPCRALLDCMFDTDPNHATGWLHATCTQVQFEKAIRETVSLQYTHLLLDWLATLAYALIPTPQLPPSVAAYLETMQHEPKPLCEVYALAESRLYEIKRRFHSMVQTSGVIQGNIMSHGDSSTSLGDEGGALSEASSSTTQQPKHAIRQAAFCEAVSSRNEEMGSGGYLPVPLAQLVFWETYRGRQQQEDSSVPCWGLVHVLQFGSTAVRHNTTRPEDFNVPLLRFAFGMFQLTNNRVLLDEDIDKSVEEDAGDVDKHILTRPQVARMLLLLIEHVHFRFRADAPPNEDEANDEPMPLSSSLEETTVDMELAMMLGILPPKLHRLVQEQRDNGKVPSQVALKVLVDHALENTVEEDSMNFDEFCRWNKAAPTDGPPMRLALLMMDLRMIAAVLFGIPPTLASMEVSLIAEIQRRHKHRYPQTQVSRRGPRGTVWYIIDNEWFKTWAAHVKVVAGTDKDAQDGRGDAKSDAVRGLGRISNKGLMAENGSLALRADIRWRHDYEIVPPLAWSALQAWYDGGPPIYRTVVPYVPSTGSASPHSSRPRIRTENEIELYPFFVTVFLCDATSRGEARPFQQYVPLSRVSPVRVMLVQLCKELDVDPNLARLWVMGGSNPDGSSDPNNNGEDWILNLDMNIVEQRKRRSHSSDHGGITLLLELKDKETGLWPRGIDGKEWAFRDKAPTEQSTSDVGDGVVGLYNMGNTCYLNSSIQCLSHTPIFREYFTSKAYLKDINTTNPLGHQGHLAQVSAVLINSLWKRFNQTNQHQPKRVTMPGSYALVNAPSLTPKTFKESLGKFNDHFQGNEQHDAQELLAFLLGGLSEDLNRIVDKPYIEAPDSDGRPDSELADIWWDNHLKREMSIIVALFTGQYKSLLTCRSCRYESARFEPFSFLQVPLPEDDHLSVSLVLYPLSEGVEPMKYRVRVKNDGTLRDVLVALSKVLIADETGENSDAASRVRAPASSGGNEDGTDDSEKVEESDEVLRRAENLVVVDLRDGYILKIAPSKWTLRDLQNSDSGELPLLHVYELDPVPEHAIVSNTVSNNINGHRERLESDPETTDDSSFEGDDNPKTKQAFLAIAQRRSEVVSQDFLHPLAHRVFGTPLLLRVVDLQKYTGRQLYDLVAKRLRNFVPKSALRFLSDHSSSEQDTSASDSAEPKPSSTASREAGTYRTTTDMEDVSAGPLPRYGFRLRLTSRDGRRCLICPWYECCIGCLIPDNDSQTRVMDGDSIVVDWHFAVDVATSSFGLRTSTVDPIVSRPLPSRARVPTLTVKSHSSCGDRSIKGGPSGGITLEDCLDAFAEEERIPEAYCSCCKDFRVQTKRMSLWRLPPVVIIHLKRFQFTQHMRRKLRDPVIFPLEGLDFSRIMAPESVASTKVDAETRVNGSEHLDPDDTTGANERTEDDELKESCQPSSLYDLYGVVHHQGALSGGHYVASLKSELDGQWRLFNDAQIYEIHPRDVVDSSAYILFYIRRDVSKAKVSDFWDVREEGLSEEDMDQLLKGRSDRCVIS